MSTTNMYIGRDYVGTVTGVTFNGVAGDNAVTVNWELTNNCGDTLGSGSGSYVSSGTYTFTIDYSYFDSEKPVNPTSYKYGNLLVRLSRSGVDGSVGTNVKFMYPPLVAA